MQQVDTWRMGEPIRRETFSREHLDEHARGLAADYSRRLQPTGSDDQCWSRFLGNSVALRAAHEAFSQAVRKGEPITTSGEWLLDNFYIIGEQLRDIQEHIPKGYYRELPKLGPGALAGFPQIYGIALELIAHTDSSLDEQTLVSYITAYQDVAALTMGELWALPSMLRLVLVENLRSMAEQELHTRAEQRAADEWMNALTERCAAQPSLARGPAASTHFLEQLKPYLERPACLIRIADRVREQGEEQSRWVEVLEHWLQDHGRSLDSLVRQEHQRQAANQVSIGNCVTSMRLISALDWNTFFEQTSPVDQVLRLDPAGVYAQMDFATRDRYRHAVEQLGKASTWSELAIARRAVDLASAPVSKADARQGHIGYWLVGNGRKEFAKTVAYRPKLLARAQHFLADAGPGIYYGSVLLLTCLTIAGLTYYASTRAGTNAWLALLAGLVMVLPASELAIALVNFLVTTFVRPSTLPKLEFKTALPRDCQTMVVVPTLLANEEGVAHLLERLEIHYLANPERGFYFSLLTDFTDADAEQLPTDKRLLDLARAGIKHLNERYPLATSQIGEPAVAADRFFLFHRSRQWNANEQKWLGWERKRGKLEEFNSLLRGARDTSYHVQEGRLTNAGGIRYIITLDTDTQLPPNAARRLVGALAHPLNSARYDEQKQRVVEGYGVLQPRVSVSLPSVRQSWFARFFAGHAGLDPYTTAVSDVYQDVFSEANFVGKGIYDVDAFIHATEGVFPENQILSHDLIEGCYARVGLVSDVELFDDFPARYHAHARRQHRWVRGDWQIAPWLFGRVSTPVGLRANPLTFLSRWKIADNLRRSLLAPACVALLIAGWTVLPGNPVIWTAIALAVLCFPLLAQLSLAVRALVSGVRAESVQQSFSDLRFPAVQVALGITFVAHQAAMMLDAIGRVLYRMLISRKHMLEWETASATERRLTLSVKSFLLSMWPSILIAVGTLICLPWRSYPVALPIIGLWFVAPWIGYWVSLPLAAAELPLDADEKLALRRIARKTWAYFENFVGAEDNWMPPDNFQEYPVPLGIVEPGMTPGLAHRTSPTNEGLYLVSALAAHDLGYIGTHELINLMEKNLNSWEKLDRYHGHFLNWYDTHNGVALAPRYVSTVDSGNLAASFLTVREGLLELLETPLAGGRITNGLLDTAQLVAEALERVHPPGVRLANPALERMRRQVEKFISCAQEPPKSIAEWRQQLRELEEHAASLPADASEFLLTIQPATEELRFATKRLLSHVHAIRRDLEALVPPETSGEGADSDTEWRAARGRPLAVAKMGDSQPWSGSTGGDVSVAETLPPSADPVALRAGQALTRPANNGAATSTLEPSVDDTSISSAALPLEDWNWRATLAGQNLSERIRRLAQRLQKLTDEMDFTLLYDPRRRLFSIGYNLENERLDASHYDLLASEARLASFIAIGKGDVDAGHWFRLGRSMTRAAGSNVLLSWSGTMFEYLMPVLFQRRFADTLLDQSCLGAVDRHIEYGRANNVPWGISESAFAALSVTQDYHYQAFGAPGLGLKRGLAQDMVVAPYATGLALLVRPHQALANFELLAKEGGLGAWGFYEALDYTRARVPAGRRVVPVRCFMSHHQGMTFTAITNCLIPGIMQKRFATVPLVRATELLLQERTPVAPILTQKGDEAEGDSMALIREVERPVSRRLTTADSPAPRTHLLANGRYSVMVTNAGTGYSNCQGTQITRWRPDSTLDPWGQFLLLRDLQSGITWSATAQPLGAPADYYEVIYSVDKAEFRRRDGGLETRLEIVVSPEHDAEVRQLTLINHGRAPRRMEVTSFAEISLIAPDADAAHPAFQKLFVQTESVPEANALLAYRRPRSADQETQWAMHVLAVEGPVLEPIAYETDRARFLGRGRTIHAPAALDRGARLSNTTGPVLDPIFSLRCALQVEPGQTRTIAFTTGLAKNRAEVANLADQYHEPRAVQRVFELAWAHTQVELRHQHLSPSDVHLYQRLAAGVLYPDARRRAHPGVLAHNRLGQSALWRFGISGDNPIVLVRVSDEEHLPLFREVLRAHEYWRTRGLKADLVVLNEHAPSYLDALQEQLAALVRNSGSANWLDKAGGVFLVRGGHMADEDRCIIHTSAQIVLDGNRGSLAQLVEPQTPVQTMPAAIAVRAPAPRVLQSELAEVPANDADERLWNNGLGGFDPQTGEYVIRLTAGRTTDAPWVNVISNPTFGCVLSESTLGYTWSENSRENKLTPWSNDPVSEPAGEAIYLRDEATGETWSPTPLPLRDPEPYEVRHSAGATRFLHRSHGVSQECVVSVAPQDPVKFVQLKLTNESTRDRELSATYYAEWVLGVMREKTHLYVSTEMDRETGVLLARNMASQDFSGRIAFLDVVSDGEDLPTSMTGDRQEFFGRLGRREAPAALQRQGLSDRVGPGLDPCGAVQTKVRIKAGETRVLTFLLGQAATLAEVQGIVKRYRSPGSVAAAIAETQTGWQEMLTAVQVRTPNAALDVLVNQWLIYQVVSCRMWGRSGFYQSGGAFGFRDQLQDCMSLVYSRPKLARAHILLAAAHQFEQGDVQHWWHPPRNRGVRTRFSDDFLWLAYVTHHYLETTGDSSILNEVIPFLYSTPLNAEEEERYETPEVSAKSDTLFGHCLRAIDNGLKFGAHGLPLMGTGDWNDGYSKVGAHGKGETVWGGMFLVSILDRFAPLVHARGDVLRAVYYREQATRLRESLESQAWDGEWYLRAFFDDGSPMGSAKNEECQIDSLPQTWAVFSKLNPQRARQAMEEVWQRLVRQEEKLVLLFTPPFDRSAQEPGYVKGYVPGVRENGGQYTHAALWVMRAFAELGDGERAMQLWDLLNPVLRSQDPTTAAKYKVEPYVVAADIYGAQPHTGRGGWTWYTGSASWMYRVALESLLGFQLRGGWLRIDPCIPAAWDGFEIEYRFGKTRYEIVVENPDHVQRGVRSVHCNGEPFADLSVRLTDDGGTHRVVVKLGAPVTATE